MFTRKVRELSQ
ncbi:hypothetical protein D031_2648A, partial [Vibrio parahaemolyticus VP-48]